MSLTDSEANFKARATHLGLGEPVLQLLVDAGLTTLSLFAFSSAYVPGQSDEKPFQDAMKAALKRDPTVGELAVLRRLLHESYALTAAELKRSVDVTEDAPTRKLAQPERAQRRSTQQAKLPGLRIVGQIEPSARLVDKCCQMYDENCVRFLELSVCTSQDAEVKHPSLKEDKLLVFGHDGSVKTRNKDGGVDADLSSELLMRYAWTRKGLALDQANILEYSHHEAWVEHLMTARFREVPPGYGRVTTSQLISADRQLWLKVADLTRTGIQLVAAGRPCDAIWDAAMNSVEVAHFLQPMPQSSSHRDGPYERPWASKGPKGKGKGSKGKGKAKGKEGHEPRVPKDLTGGVAVTPKGHAICFDHNLRGCSRATKQGQCERGLHICCNPKCFKAGHGFHVCPARAKPTE